MSLEALREVIGEIRRDLDPHCIHPPSRLVDELGLRSLELIGLIVKCEQRFAVSLISRAESLAEIATVGQLMALIAELSDERDAATRQ
jgi:acyl carrier protein